MARRPRILFIQYTNPGGYPPLQHASSLLIADGWSATFLGVATPGTEAMAFPPTPDRRVLLMRPTMPGWRQKLHYAAYIGWVLGWVLLLRPRWVYASDAMGAPPALAAALIGCDVVYHEHDAPAPTRSRFMRWIASCRATLGRRAALLVVPNVERGAALAAQVGVDHRRVHCVWNCPEHAEAEPDPVVREPDAMWLLFHGSIVPDRLPLTLLDAMKRLPQSVRLRVVGYEPAGAKGYIDRLKGHAQALGLEERVQWLGTLRTRDHLMGEARRCDVGIAFMPTRSDDINMRHMTGASNKPFDYLAAGCAVLVSDLADWNEMFVQPGYGMSCDPASAQSIAAALSWLWQHPTERQRMGAQGRERILAQWNYEAQFAQVRRLVNPQGEPVDD